MQELLSGVFSCCCWWFVWLYLKMALKPKQYVFLLVLFLAVTSASLVSEWLGFFFFVLAAFVFNCLFSKDPLKSVYLCLCQSNLFACSLLAESGEAVSWAVAFGLVGSFDYAIVYSFSNSEETEMLEGYLEDTKNRIVGGFLLIIPLVMAFLSTVLVNDSFSLWLVFIIIVVVCRSAVYLFILSYQKDAADRAALLYSSWSKDARDYMNLIRSQRHDFNFHLQAINGLIESGDYEKCHQYIDNMVQQSNDVNEFMPVYDAMVASLLMQMKNKAADKGIKINYSINYDMQNVICNSFELNKIIGNLLNNAIEACSEENGDKEIDVQINKRHNCTIISVTNAFTGDEETLLHVFDLNYSTKKQHEGIGLPMVKKTVEKYGGEIFLEIAEQKVTFTVSIPNKIVYVGE